MTIKKIQHFTRASFFIITTLICNPHLQAETTSHPQLEAKEFDIKPAADFQIEEVQSGKYTISRIHVLGNHSLSQEAIRIKTLFKEGDIFNVNKTSQSIKKIYETGYFNQVKIAVDTVSEDELDLYIIVQEKPKLHHISYDGNKQVSDKELNKELDVEHIPTINESQLDGLIAKVVALYQKKNYHHAQVSARIEPAQEKGQSDVVFTIEENKPSYIERISFKGNKSISSAQLKEVHLLS